MKQRLPKQFTLHPDVSRALLSGHPVVALESTVITHGLPKPENLRLAIDLENVVKQKAIPATIAFLDGKIRIGLSTVELQYLAQLESSHKISSRDISTAITNKWNGGTTVSATLFAANRVGIKVFATGGIGGVHRGKAFDISADLLALASTPLVVVCSGAKAILDLPATREHLETLGVPVIGYQTGEFPGFYSAESGLRVDHRVEDVEEVVRIAWNHWEVGLTSAILLVNPPPLEYNIPRANLESDIQQALESAEERGITGAALTPYLLDQVSTLSAGKSLQTNLALLKSNARLAAELAHRLGKDEGIMRI